MKKALIFTAVGLFCFVAGTVGIYVAMPALSPETVDSTRVRLDSLGLIGQAETDHALPVSLDSLPSEPLPSGAAVPGSAEASDSSVLAGSRPAAQEIIETLSDSLRASARVIRALAADTSALGARAERLRAQVEALTAKDFEATALSQSLSKLDSKQLGSILAELELDIIELLYQKASARERTRLLEVMGPDQAARFVRTLVKGPQPVPDPDAVPVDTPNGGDPAPPNL
jgi:hypothetical protein